MTIDIENLTAQVLIDNPDLGQEVLSLELEAKAKGNIELCMRLGQVVDAVVSYRGEGKLPADVEAPEADK